MLIVAIRGSVIRRRRGNYKICFKKEPSISFLF